MKTDINNKYTANYIATAMNRHYIDEGVFVYSSSHVIIGDIDEKTKVFTDMDGNTYGSMLDSDYRLSEIPTAYGNLIPMKDLPLVIKSKAQTIEGLVKDFNNYTKKIIFFGGRFDDGQHFYLPLSIKDFAQQVAAQFGKTTQLLESNSQDEEEYDDYYYEDDEMDPELVELINDVVNGKYKLNELKAIRDNLIRGSEDIESVIDTIDLQIEATENGKIQNTSKVETTKKANLAKKDVSIEEDLIDTEDIFNKVTQHLIAQDEAAHRVITEIARKELHQKKKKEGILLTGSTGVGKTHLMSLIAKYLNRPFHKITSTSLTTAGYTGKDIEECLWDLYVKCGKNKEKTEKAIIFFDEIDKKGSSKKDDHSGQGVLNVLLSFIEGAVYDACADMKSSTDKVKIDTSNMIVILGGAYNDVYKTVKEDKVVGFNSPSPKEISNDRVATVEDFVQRAMMTDEFMGRVTVVRLKDLTIEDLKRVMLESKDSAIKIQEEIFNKLGVKIRFTDGYTTAIATEAFNKKTGARGLNSVVDETTWLAFDEVHKKSNRGLYSEVIFDEETVKDPSHFQLVKKCK